MDYIYFLDKSLFGASHVNTDDVGNGCGEVFIYRFFFKIFCITYQQLLRVMSTGGKPVI